MKDGKLGEFSVAAIKGKRPDLERTGGGATSPLDRYLFMQCNRLCNCGV